MTIPQADGTTAATLHGPGLQNTPQTEALRGPVCAADKRKRRRKPNTRRRPRNGNTARRRARRTNLKSLTGQRVKGLCLQRESPGDPVLHPAPLQITIIHQLGGDGGPRCLLETRGPTLDPTRPVSPDLEGGPGLIQGPEAYLGLEVGLCPDPDLSPILDPGRDQDPGTDQGLHPERGVHPDPQEKGKPASPNWTPLSVCLKSFQTAKSRLSPESPLSRLLKVSL